MGKPLALSFSNLLVLKSSLPTSYKLLFLADSIFNPTTRLFESMPMPLICCLKTLSPYKSRGFKSNVVSFIKSNFIKLALMTFLMWAGTLLLADELQQHLKLLGVIEGGNRPAVVLIKNLDNNQIKAIRINGSVWTFGTIVSVGRNSIIIKEPDNRLTTLSSKLGGSLSRRLGDSATLAHTPLMPVDGDRYSEDGFQRVGNKIEVDSRYRDRMVKEELPKILMQASSEPVVEGSEIKGFRIFQIEPGSIYQKMGVKDGDVVQEINGVPLNNVAKTIQFMNGLKTENSVTVKVLRNGQSTSLDLNVK